MTTSTEFTQVLHEWSEVFMHRSMRDFRTLTRSTGLSMAQIITLMHLYHSGSCAVTDIGMHLGVTNAASSQMVNKLVEQGLLERYTDPKDRRSRQVSLSSKGHGLVQKFINSRYKWMQELTAELRPDEQETISAALTCLTQTARALK